MCCRACPESVDVISVQSLSPPVFLLCALSQLTLSSCAIPSSPFPPSPSSLLLLQRHPDPTRRQTDPQPHSHQQRSLRPHHIQHRPPHHCAQKQQQRRPKFVVPRRDASWGAEEGVVDDFDPDGGEDDAGGEVCVEALWEAEKGRCQPVSESGRSRRGRFVRVR